MEKIIDRREKTLLDICAEAWRARLFIMTGLMLGILAASAFVYAARPYYRAQMIVAPANPINGADVSSLLGNNDSFALRYIAQSVGAANSSDFMRFENVYGGPSVAAYLLKDGRITQGLREDAAFTFSRVRQDWDPEDLSEYILRRVRLESVGATPMRRMVYLHPDREFAAYFLSSIHRITDELIRLKIKNDAAKRSQYLQEAIAKTANPEHRRALTTLLLEQERLRMLVSIETSYAADVIEPGATESRPGWPQIPLIFTGFMFAGLLAGFTFYGLAEAGAHNQSDAQGDYSIRRRRWFRTNSGNTNKRTFNARNAAE